MVENLPCSAGDTGLIPGWGTKIPRAEEQLSPCTTTTEPTAAITEAHAPRACASKREAVAMRNLSTAMKSSPGLLQVEKACVQR